MVTVVRDGSFLGVITEREEVALRAADLLRADAKWHEAPTLPDEDALTCRPHLGARRDQGPGRIPPPSSAAPTPAARSHEATYHRPYLAHAAMGPSTATALASTAPAGDEAGVRLKVWTHSQGVYPLRRELARFLKLTENQVRVRHVEGAGCYGHNAADDAAMDAALLAMAVPGRPCKWSGRAPTSSAGSPSGRPLAVRVTADVDARGDVLSWRHENVWGNGHVTRPGFGRSIGLLAASHRDGGEPIEPSRSRHSSGVAEPAGTPCRATRSRPTVW